MQKILAAACATTLVMMGCSKKTEAPPAEGTEAPAAELTSPATTSSAQEPAPAVEPSEAERERAQKQALLDYSTMEDKYINDPRAQWAVAATASSSFGDASKEPPGSQASSTPWQATGPPNGSPWTNNNQDIGFDWLEASFARPVAATEVRVVMSGSIVGTVSKLELVDTDGKYHDVWAGIDETRPDDRGSRTWFVRTFAATPYKAAGVKITVANAMNTGYKEIDALQIVGD